MIRIKLHTKIQAPIERIFNLARSIDFHKVSMDETKEEVIAGSASIDFIPLAYPFSITNEWEISSSKNGVYPFPLFIELFILVLIPTTRIFSWGFPFPFNEVFES